MQVMKDDIVEMITLKSLLFSLDEEECLEKCNSFQAYEEFLYDTSLLLTLEPDFFLLDKDYMEKFVKLFILIALNFIHQI